MIKKLLVAAAGLFVLYVAYSTFLAPRIQDINDQASQYENATQVLDERISRASGANPGEVTTELGTLRTQLPPSADQRAMISETAAVFQAAGVTWIGGSTNTAGDEGLITFDASGVEGGGLLEVGLSFNIEGSVDEVRNALAGLTQLERHYSVTAVNLTFTNQTRDGVDAPPDQVTASIEASAWVWKASPVPAIPVPEPQTPDDEAAEG